MEIVVHEFPARFLINSPRDAHAPFLGPPLQSREPADAIGHPFRHGKIETRLVLKPLHQRVDEYLRSVITVFGDDCERVELDLINTKYLYAFTSLLLR